MYTISGILKFSGIRQYTSTQYTCTLDKKLQKREEFVKKVISNVSLYMTIHTSIMESWK